MLGTYLNSIEVSAGNVIVDITVCVIVGMLLRTSCPTSLAVSPWGKLLSSISSRKS